MSEHGVSDDDGDVDGDEYDKAHHRIIYLYLLYSTLDNRNRNIITSLFLFSGGWWKRKKKLGAKG